MTIDTNAPDSSAALSAYVQAWRDVSIPVAAVYKAFHKAHDWHGGGYSSLCVPEFLGALAELGWTVDVIRDSPGPEHPVIAAYADADAVWRVLEAADGDAFEEGWEGTDAEGDWVSTRDTWSPESFVKGCEARGVTFVRRPA